VARGIVHESLDGLLVANVHHAGGAGAAAGNDLLPGVEQFVLEQIAGPHMRAALGECEGDRAAEAVRGTGDDCHFTAEVDDHDRLLVEGTSAANASSVASDCGRASRSIS